MREFDLNWRTVKREATRDGPRQYPERGKPTALTSAQQAHLERRLAACPTIRVTVLHDELCCDYGHRASYRLPPDRPGPLGRCHSPVAPTPRRSRPAGGLLGSALPQGTGHHDRPPSLHSPCLARSPGAAHARDAAPPLPA